MGEVSVQLDNHMAEAYGQFRRPRPPFHFPLASACPEHELPGATRRELSRFQLHAGEQQPEGTSAGGYRARDVLCTEKVVWWGMAMMGLSMVVAPAFRLTCALF